MESRKICGAGDLMKLTLNNIYKFNPWWADIDGLLNFLPKDIGLDDLLDITDFIEEYNRVFAIWLLRLQPEKALEFARACSNAGHVARNAAAHSAASALAASIYSRNFANNAASEAVAAVEDDDEDAAAVVARRDAAEAVAKRHAWCFAEADAAADCCVGATFEVECAFAADAEIDRQIAHLKLLLV
jgi:acyl-homoserine lactone acylase PvdQ